MPDDITPEPLGLATAGQLRRAGFVVEPTDTDPSATSGFDIVVNHTDPSSVPEFEKAKKRGDAFPKKKKP